MLIVITSKVSAFLNAKSKRLYVLPILFVTASSWAIGASVPEVDLDPKETEYANVSFNAISSGEADIDDEVPSTVAANQTQNCSLSLAEFVIYFYIQTSICFVGFILNLINLVVFRRPQFSGAAYTYMTAMSVADALTLLNYMPVGLLRCTGYFPYCQNASFKAFRTAVFYYNAYITFAVNNMSEAASVWFTVLLSIERYMAMRNLGVSFRTRRNRLNATCEKKTSGLYSETECPSDTAECRPTCSFDSHQSAKKITESRSSKITESVLSVLRHFKLSSCHVSCPRCHCRIPGSLRKLNVRYSIIVVTMLSIILNTPFFFAQAVKDISQTGATANNTNCTSINKLILNCTTPRLSSSPVSQSATRLRIEMTKFGQSEFYKAFTWFKTILVQILPLVFLCVANFRLFHFIHVAGHRRQQVLSGKTATKLEGADRHAHKQKLFGKHKQNLRNPTVNYGSSSRWQTAQRKLTILLIVIVALFVAGQIPQSIAYVEIYTAFIKPLHSSCASLHCCRPYQIYRAVANTACLFTYAVNFFVYLVLNKHFRKQLTVWCRSLCPCCTCKRTKPVLHLRESVSNFLSPARQDPKTVPVDVYGRNTFSRVGRSPVAHLNPMDYPSEAVSAPDAYGLLPDHSELTPRTQFGEKRSCSHLFRTLKKGCTQRKSSRLNTDQADNFNQHSANIYRMNRSRVYSEQPIQHRNYMTEIQFSSDREPFVSHSYKACYSYDSILKKVVVERNFCLYCATSSVMDPVSSSGLTDHTHGQYSSLLHCSRNSIMTLSRPTVSSSTHPLMPVATGSNNDQEMLPVVSSPIFTTFPIPNDSYSSCSHLFSPIAYQESDFDVISVDESLNVDQKIYNSAV